MGEEHWSDWLFSSPQGQFVVGVLVLVFGSKAILSEEVLKEKLGGLGMIGRWFRKRQLRTAQEEVDEISRLRLENELYHRYIVLSIEYMRRVELKAATEGFELPKPRLPRFYQFRDSQTGKEDEDDEAE